MKGFVGNKKVGNPSQSLDLCILKSLPSQMGNEMKMPKTDLDIDNCFFTGKGETYYALIA